MPLARMVRIGKKKPDRFNHCRAKPGIDPGKGNQNSSLYALQPRRMMMMIPKMAVRIAWAMLFAPSHNPANAHCLESIHFVFA